MADVPYWNRPSVWCPASWRKESRSVGPVGVFQPKRSQNHKRTHFLLHVMFHARRSATGRRRTGVQLLLDGRECKSMKNVPVGCFSPKLAFAEGKFRRKTMQHPCNIWSR
eukprot:scaffold44797_cov45-Phaeocystis_antarctica.AAC.1